MSEPPKDRIRVEGLEIEAPVGVYPHEQEKRQKLIVDLTLYTDVRDAARSDDLALTVDYDRASAIAREVALERHHRLIETIAEEIAARLLSESVRWVEVRVAKPGAVPDARTVSVEIQRRRP